MYLTGLSNVTAIQFNPEFFRRSALDGAGMNRQDFLNRELVNLNAAIYQYQEAAYELMRKGAELDGVNDVATWLTRIGATVGTVTTAAPLVSVISWAVAGVGLVWNSAAKKKDNRKAQDLSKQAQKLQIEAQQIKDYYDRYSSELQLIKLRPAMIGGIVGLVFLSRK